jgi:hypothetical protein
MNYLYLLVIFIAITWIAYSCFAPREELITEVKHNGHRLAVHLETKTVGLGVETFTPQLHLDGKAVAHGQGVVPLSLAAYPDWIVKTYSEKVNSWVVYVSPKDFQRTDFEQIVACYENNRTNFDAALQTKLGSKYATERYARLGRLIFGEAPQPLRFTSDSTRYTLGDAGNILGFTDKATISEYLSVQPDGKWELHVGIQEGGHSFGSPVAYGQLTLENGQTIFQPDLENWSDKEYTVRPDAGSRLDYLRSFKDAQGKHLYEVFVWNSN